MSAPWNHTNSGQTTLPHGFSVYQPTVGSPLQFIPAMGTRQLDEMLHAYLPGPAPIGDKRAAVSLDFLEQLHLTGQNYKFYQVDPLYSVLAPETPSSSTSSPLLDSGASSQGSFPATPSWDFTSVTTAPASSSHRSRNPAHRKGSIKASARRGTSRGLTADFSSLPGMQIMTRDGTDITNCASRGSKTKEQRDHAHLMRIIKACDSCRAKKVRCDPSHKKRPAASSSLAERSPPTQVSSTMKLAKCPKLVHLESYSPSNTSNSFSSSVAVPSEDDWTSSLTNELSVEEASMSPIDWRYSDSMTTLLGRAMVKPQDDPNNDHGNVGETRTHLFSPTLFPFSARFSTSDSSDSPTAIYDSSLSNSWGDISIANFDGTIAPALLESQNVYAERATSPHADGIAKVRNGTPSLGQDGVAGNISSLEGGTVAAQLGDFTFDESVSSTGGVDPAGNAGSPLNMFAVNDDLLVSNSGLRDSVAEDPGKMGVSWMRNLLTVNKPAASSVTTGHRGSRACNALVVDTSLHATAQQPISNVSAHVVAADLGSNPLAQCSPALHQEEGSVTPILPVTTAMSPLGHAITTLDICQLGATTSANDWAKMLRITRDRRLGWASCLLTRHLELLTGYLASLYQSIILHWMAVVLAHLHSTSGVLRIHDTAPAIGASSATDRLASATYSRSVFAS